MVILEEFEKKFPHSLLFYNYLSHFLRFKRNSTIDEWRSDLLCFEIFLIWGLRCFLRMSLAERWKKTFFIHWKAFLRSALTGFCINLFSRIGSEMTLFGSIRDFRLTIILLGVCSKCTGYYFLELLSHEHKKAVFDPFHKLGHKKENISFPEVQIHTIFSNFHTLLEKPMLYLDLSQRSGNTANMTILLGLIGLSFFPTITLP